MSRRSQPPPDLQQQQGVGQVEEEVIEGVGEGDEIMEDAQVGEGDYSMSVSKPSPLRSPIAVHLLDAELYAGHSAV